MCGFLFVSWTFLQAVVTEIFLDLHDLGLVSRDHWVFHFLKNDWLNNTDRFRISFYIIFHFHNPFSWCAGHLTVFFLLPHDSICPAAQCIHMRTSKLFNDLNTDNICTLKSHRCVKSTFCHFYLHASVKRPNIQGYRMLNFDQGHFTYKKERNNNVIDGFIWPLSLHKRQFF